MDYNLAMRKLTERLCTEAVRQGFQVRRTESGQYHFIRGHWHVIAPPPRHQQDWRELLRALIQAGLEWPPPPRTRDRRN